MSFLVGITGSVKMPYCPKCGKLLEDRAQYCPSCGTALNNYHAPSNYSSMNVYDSGSIGWGILGFFIPLVGFILWLAWMDVKPKSAKMAGLGALISLALGVISTVLIFILMVAVAANDPTVFEIIYGSIVA